MLELQKVIKTLRAQINSNKMFLYMVIHDLKHPCDSMISQLSHLQTSLEEHLVGLEVTQTDSEEILK